jgi:PAS domain S-box-containing protein
MTLVQELELKLGFSEVFIESIRDGLLITDTEGKIIMVNSACCRITGFDRDELLDISPPFPFWPPEYHSEYDSGFRRLLNEGFKGEFESIHLRKGGIQFPASVFIASIKDTEQRVIAHLGLIRDITEIEGSLSQEEFHNEDIFSMLNYKEKHLDLFAKKSLLSRLDYTLNNISDGIVSLDTDWCYTYVNRKAGELLGREPGSLIGKHIWTEFPEGVDLPFYKAYNRAFATQQKQVFQEYYQTFDSWFENRIYPSEGGLTIYFSDITEKKKAEESIIQKEQILNLINESLTQPLFILKVGSDHNYTFISASKSLLSSLGLEEVEILNKPVEGFIPEPSLSIALKNYKKAISSKKTVRWEESTSYNAGVKTEIITISPLFNDEGNPTHLVGFVYDISERKKVEALLLENEKYLNNILNNIGDPIFVKDEQSRLLLVNDAFCTLFGLSKPDIMGKTLAEDVSPEERESFLKIDKEVIATGIENVNEESLTVRRGETRSISTKKTRFIDEKGKKFLIGIIHDITERKKAELELKSAKDYSEGLIESMHEGLVVFDMSTEIIDVNPSFCEMSGFSEKELLGQECPYPFSPPEIEAEADLRHQLISGGEELDSYETIYMRKDGSRFNVDVTVSGIKNAEGEVMVYFGTVVDTTQRKKAELDLKLAKDFTDNLVMSMQEGLLIVNLEGRIIMVNESTCNILGYARDELIGMNLPYPFARPEDFEKIAKTNQQVAAGDAPSFQFEFIRKNGKHFWRHF